MLSFLKIRANFTPNPNNYIPYPNICVIREVNYLNMKGAFYK